MNKNTFKLKINPEENIVNQPLDEIVRNGANEMLQKALEIEVDLFLERYQYILDEQGNRKVIRNGRGRTRNIDELLPVLYLKGISTGDFNEALESILVQHVIGLTAQNIVRLKQVWQKE